MILFFAFVIGWASAKFIGQYVFVSDAPHVVVDKGPRTKILVAKTEIAIGQEILAEHVSYVDVPVSELPARAITSFGEVYRRRPAFPIPVSCPICEDLLIAKNDEQNPDNNAKFIPAGYTIVSFDVALSNKRNAQNANNQNQFAQNKPEFLPVTKNNIRENSETGESNQLLKKGNRVDVRVITKRTPKGTHATIKEQVLQTYADKFYFDSVSELVLENVPIHNITNYGHDAIGNNLQKVSFLLEESKIELLTNAAKKGRLRIVARQTEKNEQIKTADETNITIANETTTAAENTQYKGFNSYAQKLKAKQKTSKNKTNANQTNTTILNDADLTTIKNFETKDQNINNDKNLIATKNITITTPNTTLTTNAILTPTPKANAATPPSLWVMPLYLRDIFELPSAQNINNTQNTTENKTAATTAANFNNTNANENENENEKNITHANKQNLVFIKPQVNQTTTQDNNDNNTGRSNTSKYLIGNNSTNIKDKN
ncbi:MAG: hypothetical protein LBP59_12590 [Planctomycetaceae bacterium]|nr:hypothetical protein [Planctomycetaceae bacterium]